MHGQQGGDCRGKVDIRGVDGNGKNKIKCQVFKNVKVKLDVYFFS